MRTAQRLLTAMRVRDSHSCSGGCVQGTMNVADNDMTRSQIDAREATTALPEVSCSTVTNQITKYVYRASTDEIRKAQAFMLRGQCGHGCPRCTLVVEERLSN